MFKNFFSENHVERGRPQMTIWRVRVACWLPKATNTHSGCVILIAFLMQQWLHETASMIRYTYFACVFILASSLLRKCWLCVI